MRKLLLYSIAMFLLVENNFFFEIGYSTPAVVLIIPLIMFAIIIKFKVVLTRNSMLLFMLIPVSTLYLLMADNLMFGLKRYIIISYFVILFFLFENIIVNYDTKEIVKVLRNIFKLLFAVIIIAFLVGGSSRIQLLSPEPAWLSRNLALLLPFYFDLEKQKKFFLTFLVALLAFLIVSSITGVLLFAVFLAQYSLFIMIKRGTYTSKGKLRFIVVLLIAVLLFSMMLNYYINNVDNYFTGHVKKIMHNSLFDSESFRTRYILGVAPLTGWINNPFGSGLGNFITDFKEDRDLYGNMLTKEIMSREYMDFKNIFSGILYEIGFFGLLLPFVFLNVIYKAMKAKNLTILMIAFNTIIIYLSGYQMIQPLGIFILAFLDLQLCRQSTCRKQQFQRTRRQLIIQDNPSPG